MGHGQFTVDSKTLKKLNDIDDAIVELVSMERSDDTDFKKKVDRTEQHGCRELAKPLTHTVR